MKSLHIALLLAAGAGGGALVMTLVHQRAQETPAPAVVQLPAGAQAVAPAPAPVRVQLSPVVSATPESPKQAAKQIARNASPRQSPWEAPRPGRTRTAPPPTPDPAPQAPVIQKTPEPVVAAPPVSEPPAAEPLKVEPPKETIPPARVELENATPVRPPAPPEPARVTLNAGTLISVRLVDGLSAERNVPGDPFTATLDKELVVNGLVIAERGARVEGRVTGSDRGGRVKGVSALAVELARLHTRDGQTVSIRTDPFERHAQETHGEDALKVGAGAALGAAIGAIAGGGKGAAIGAGAGGAAGAGTVLATRGRPAALPTETRVTFRLSAPVTLTERR